jgi:CheY-like chemotaxis protein
MSWTEDSAPRRVLLVDDEEIDLTVVAEAVARLGFHVTATRDPGEAIRLMERELFDIIISDYIMPGIDGLQLLRRARHFLPDSIRIILTSSRDFDVAVEAINRGEVFRFLRKPLEERELGMSLRIAVQHMVMREEIVELRQALMRRDELLKRLEEARVTPSTYGLRGQ